MIFPLSTIAEWTGENGKVGAANRPAFLCPFGLRIGRLEMKKLTKFIGKIFADSKAICFTTTADIQHKTRVVFSNWVIAYQESNGHGCWDNVNIDETKGERIIEDILSFLKDPSYTLSIEGGGINGE